MRDAAAAREQRTAADNTPPRGREAAAANIWPCSYLQQPDMTEKYYIHGPFAGDAFFS